MTHPRVLIVGNPGEIHVGRHFLRAAEHLGLTAELFDVLSAWGGNRFVQKFLWVWDRRPYRLEEFGRRLLERCHQFGPTVVVVTGISPPSVRAIHQLVRRDIRVVNFLTDDPFNPNHRARWFDRVLPQYTAVFTPRRSNLTQLSQFGCQCVKYLPFAYLPQDFHPVPRTAERSCDVVFVGGGDRDRIPFVEKLLTTGIPVDLYGAYWDRYPQTASSHRGIGDLSIIRSATASAKLCLILVRRANRDGHVMRTFEAAACGACLLVEDTEEHREIFADTVTYFQTPDELVHQARGLLADPDRRKASAEASYHRIVTDGRNTYADRLRTILELVKDP